MGLVKKNSDPEVRKIHTTNVDIVEAMASAFNMALDKNPMLSIITEDMGEVCADTILLLELNQKGERE